MAANSESSGLTATSWWTVDTCQEFPLTVGATALVQKCIQAHGWSLEFTTQVLDGYKKLLTFMNMFQDYNATKFYPPLPVDKMWQQHVLDAASYEADCQLLFGRMLHRPDAALDEETKNRRIERTLYVLRLQCKEDYDRAVWDFGREVDTADQKKRGLRPRTNRVDWSKKLDVTEDTSSLRARTSSSKKRKKNDAEEERKRRRTHDGCLLPAREPKRNSNGTYNRPAGRVPFGMSWDIHRGLYVPISGKDQAAVKVEQPITAALKDYNGSTTSSRNARKTPKKNADGTYIRPCGRVPSGMVWDENRGVFTRAKEEQPTRAAAVATPRPRKPKPVRASSSSKKGSGKRGERTEDGCFRPASVPRVKDDGTFARPAGRGPAGMVWDAIRGLYVPHAAFGRASMSLSPNSVPCVTPTASIGSTDGGDIFNGAGTHSHGTRNVRRVSADMGHEEAKG